MPYSPTPFQELPDQWFQIERSFFNMTDTDGAADDTEVTLPTDMLLCAMAGERGSIASTSNSFIKSLALEIAQGPPAPVTTGVLSPSYRVEAVDFTFDVLGGLSAASGFVNVLLGKLTSSQTLVTPSAAAAAGSTSLQVSNAYSSISSTGGPAITAATGKTLSRTTLQGASNIVAGQRVSFDLTGNIVATTAANSVTTTAEDFRLYPGEKLVLIFLPAKQSGTSDDGTAAFIRRLRTNVVVNTRRQ